MAALALLASLAAWGQGADAPAPPLPALCVEIGPEHPLFLFEDGGAGCADAAAYVQQATDAWKGLPKELQPYSTLVLLPRGADPNARQAWTKAVLAGVQQADVPCVLRIADRDPHTIMPLGQLEETLDAFPCVRGVQITGLAFDEYAIPGAEDALGESPLVRWLGGAIEQAARHGRFLTLELEGIGWPRLMSDPACAGLRDQIRTYAKYVIPVAAYRGSHTIAQMSATMGGWLEGLSTQWGVGARSQWYTDAGFLQPGLFGTSDAPPHMPASLYRAMILLGAMTGATVYTFSPESDLWFGPAAGCWTDAIRPTLRDIVELALIARPEQVKKKARTALQLAPAKTPQEFHTNLRDIDGVLDAGFLIQGAYGMEKPGQIPELIPNTGRHYWVPILLATPPEGAAKLFDNVVPAGKMGSPQAWTELLDRAPQADGEGTAFISSIGRGLFVLNTAENTLVPQTFRLASVPAPVRGFEAKRQADGVLVTWPFRPDDLSYKIHRRMGAETRFSLLASTGENRQYLDKTADPSQPVAYSITALTDAKEPYEGVVNHGDYLALSTVESRIAEEVAVTPLLAVAQSRPLEAPAAAPAVPQAWWPNFTGLTDKQVPVANAIARQIEDWDHAFAARNLTGVLGFYSEDYEDPQGWRFLYARRAYQWFFENYQACAMYRQIRNWDFSAFESSGTVGVLLYCRFTGYAVSDPSGRIADTPAYFPRTKNGEAWIYFSDREGVWRIIKTNPAVPNFKDILGFSASPYTPLAPGPDSP